MVQKPEYYTQMLLNMVQMPAMKVISDFHFKNTKSAFHSFSNTFGPHIFHPGGSSRVQKFQLKLVRYF